MPVMQDNFGLEYFSHSLSGATQRKIDPLPLYYWLDTFMHQRILILDYGSQVTQLIGQQHVEKVEITTKDGEVITRPAQAVVAALGFVADLSAMKDWGLEFDKRHISVGPDMATNLPRVFAAGDINEYPGKVRLIAVGFGDVATAVNNAAVVIDPDAHVFPGHSSEGS